MGRFPTGITPALAADVRAAGGARDWFEQQLVPEGPSADPGIEKGCATGGQPGCSSLSRKATSEKEPVVDGVEAGWEVMVNYGRWALVRRTKSRRQVLELMREFWENHFNVPANGDGSFPWRTDYGVALRRERALGFVRGPAPDRHHPTRPC